MNFQDLKVDKKYIDILEENYIVEPTEVQQEAIPAIRSGRNVIVKAQTGTGKTLAFLLPILADVDEELSHIQAVILTPTRELADQITRVGKQLVKDSKISVESVFGGHRIGGQISRIGKNTQIVVGTPGRILDHLRNGTINFKYLKTVVIDEADQMLAYGFIDDIYLIHSKLPEKQQILLFSATMQNNVHKLIHDIMPNPKKIEINPKQVVVDKIKQLVIVSSEERKLDSLLYAIDVYKPFMSIIFTKSKQRAKMLYGQLVENGITSIELLHGELSQSKREKILKDFRKMKVEFLIATDIAARGIDVSGITHIFNFDVPRDAEYYVHRIGRTGRMGDDGAAITLMDENEQRYLEKIEKYIHLKLNRVYDRNSYERSRLNEDELKNFEVKKPAPKRYRAKSGARNTDSKSAKPREYRKSGKR
ncbi:MAG: DEAD/DEAH box helicase [Peptostreptococcaceae bacterium]|nr:DEAD/DEAH box helicase [Peptostreptococcaceae bacterium]